MPANIHKLFGKYLSHLHYRYNFHPVETIHSILHWWKTVPARFLVADCSLELPRMQHDFHDSTRGFDGSKGQIINRVFWEIDNFPCQHHIGSCNLVLSYPIITKGRTTDGARRHLREQNKIKKHHSYKWVDSFHLRHKIMDWVRDRKSKG